MDLTAEYSYRRRKTRVPLLSRNRTEPPQGSTSARDKVYDGVILPKRYARNQHRASTACETCRRKKVKCSEETPSCAFCKRQGFRCEYQLRNGPSQDQLLSRVLEHLAQVEEKLETLLPSGLPEKQGDYIEDIDDDYATLNTETSPGSPVVKPKLSSSLPSPADQQDTNQPQQTASPPVALRTPHSPGNERLNSYQNVTTVAQDPGYRVQYLKRTPFSREQARSAMPKMLDGEQTKLTDIMPLLTFFFEEICPLFPIICDQVTFSMASAVVTTGFRDDLQSCLILIMLGLSKAYKYPSLLNSGLADFQHALQIFGRLSVQFTLEYAQAQVLAALFLLKKGRLISFWSYLHAGCTTLYTMIRRNEAEGLEVSPDDRRTTLRLYWISYNLERDLVHESDSFPPSLLYRLEDHLPLPLGCDESHTIHMKTSVRTVYTFFLAEMSLKAILSRIHATPNPEYFVQNAPNGNIEISPLIRELKNQLTTWEASLPSFLGWSPEPRRGVAFPTGMRLKLLYWFARFSLFKPLIVHFLQDPTNQLPFLGWKSFQDGLLAGLNMIRISTLEDSEVDAIMGNRLVSTMSILRGAFLQGCFEVMSDDDVDGILQDCKNMLWRRLACDSEWITCRLETLQYNYT